MITPYDNIRIIASEKRPYLSCCARPLKMSAYFQKDIDTIDKKVVVTQPFFLHEICNLVSEYPPNKIHTDMYKTKSAILIQYSAMYHVFKVEVL